MPNPRKAGVIGCGYVGASIAFALMQKALFSDLVLLDADRAKAEGEAMDLSHGLAYAASMDIYAGDYLDLRDAGLVIITAGANQKPGETRLDLIHRNAAILENILPRLTTSGFEGVLLIVSNPVDVLTYLAQKLSGYPEHRVLGSGTVLDTARLKYLLSHRLRVDGRSVHALVIGEHGDSELSVWSGANIAGIDLDHFGRIRGLSPRPEVLKEIHREVRDSAYEIIRRKGATYFGIAVAVVRIAECIVKDEQSILAVSAVLTGQYGLSGLAMSLPSIIGKNGVEAVLEIPLSQEEHRALMASADRLKAALGSL